MFHFIFKIPILSRINGSWTSPSFVGKEIIISFMSKVSNSE